MLEKITPEPRSFQKISQDQKENRDSNCCVDCCKVASTVAILAAAFFAIVLTCIFAPVVPAIIFTLVIVGVAAGIAFAVNGCATGVVVHARPRYYPAWRRPTVAVLPPPVLAVHARAPRVGFAAGGMHARVGAHMSPHRIRQ